jgi:pimeloyl-ACP methyl ester carboxylesterase
MLARIVRVSLLLELAAYAVPAWWLHARHGWGIAQLAASIVALALAARLALAALTTTIGAIAGSPREPAHRIGPAGMARLILQEWRALVLDNFFYLPFERLALRPDLEPAPNGGMPVVLVHGYFSNRGYFAPLVEALEAGGVAPVFTPNFRTVFTSIDHFVDELDREIERIAAGSGHERVVLVCHSMGGLAAREYLRRRGSGRVAKLVTISSPHHGTLMALFGIGPNAGQMRRGSDFLGTLAASESREAPAIPATSIYSPHDNLVAPQETSRLAWAKNVALPGLGHVAILGSGRLYAVLLDEVREALGASR